MTQKRSKNGHLWVLSFHNFFFQNWKKWKQKNGFLCCSFSSNYNLDTFSTLKWTSAPKFCERYSYSWHKMTKNDHKVVKCKDRDIWTWTDYNQTNWKISQLSYRVLGVFKLTVAAPHFFDRIKWSVIWCLCGLKKVNTAHAIGTVCPIIYSNLHFSKI